MEMTVKQAAFNLAHYEYKCYIGDVLTFIGSVNRTIFPVFRKIRLFDPSKMELCSLKQENLFRFILSYVPVIGWLPGKDCPYTYYSNGMVGGKFEYHIFKAFYSGIIDNKQYAVYEHVGNDFSIYCDDEQVGSIHRNAWKNWDADRYQVLFNKNINPQIIALLTLFTDIHSNTMDTSTNQISYEKTIYVFGSRKQDRTWVPKD